MSSTFVSISFLNFLRNFSLYIFLVSLGTAASGFAPGAAASALGIEITFIIFIGNIMFWNSLVTFFFAPRNNPTLFRKDPFLVDFGPVSVFFNLLNNSLCWL